MQTPPSPAPALPDTAASAAEAPGPVADANLTNWVDRFSPNWLKPYARLARWDRPIGFWLLFWPCGFGLALAALSRPTHDFNWTYLLLIFIGAILMRGAGCTFNDIVDRDIDDKVARTRLRPIPSGQVTTRQAMVFLVAQSLLGLVVLLQFNLLTVELGVGSLVLVAIYPFMKRITWWPQFFLGLAFSWGALVGWAAEEANVHAPVLILYLGCILWVIGYDTIYALQDIEDDALIGVKSTARLFGKQAKPIVALFYTGAVVLWGLAAWSVGGGMLFTLGLVCVAGLLAWQVVTVDTEIAGNPLVRFKANFWVGLILTVAMLADWRS